MKATVMTTEELKNKQNCFFVNGNIAVIATSGSFGYKMIKFGWNDFYEFEKVTGLKFPEKYQQGKGSSSEFSHSIAQMKECGFDLMTEKQMKATGKSFIIYTRW